jgi:hypothetical protein
MNIQINELHGISIYDILWKKLNIIVEKKRLGTPIFKGFILFMGLEIL